MRKITKSFVFKLKYEGTYEEISYLYLEFFKENNMENHYIELSDIMNKNTYTRVK